MRCRSCRHDNPVGARFCVACGTRLAIACAACGAELPDGARFCPACGGATEATRPAVAPAQAPDVYTPRHLAERILTSRAALQGERKPVTVLFCDLVGSTALAERLGPDAMHDLLNRFFETALAEIHRYEGTVNQFLGDGFMALFGAPLAHEDHARRAALAALGVARAVQGPLVLDSGAAVPISVRMGLNTGLVVVGAIGDNLRMDYTAVGDSTHLAARLQQSAAPGTILVSQATARLIEDHVALEPFGTLDVRGLSGPVTAFRLSGPAAVGTDAARSGRVRSRFVGREREAATLRELIGEVIEGHGRVAGVVGEPGLGKSRLLLEVRAEVGEEVTWLEGRCLSYGSTIPYLPILDLLRGACGIVGTDAPERAAEKVRATLQTLGIDPGERAALLLRLLGLEEPDETVRALGGEVLAARTLDTLRQVWLRSSRRRPLVLVVEDVHWIDPASETCLAGLAEALGRSSLLLVTTYRPGYRPSWIDRSYATQISLAPLRHDDSLRVVHSLLQEVAPADPLVPLILDRAEGNPFFLEELVHALGDTGGTTLGVPDSVQGVLAARIDRLPETAKHLLQTAAVLGREFPERLLRAIADTPERLDADLHDLTRLEFLYERSDAEERAWVFKHALTQDVAHTTLVAPRRRALHRRAADALAALYPDRLADLAPRLAHHYLEAEAWGEAATHARRAAMLASRAWANTEAVARYDQALHAAVRAGLPAVERCEMLQARAELHAVLGHFEPARTDLEAALALADGDAVRQGRVLTALGALWGGHRDYARGLDLTRQAVGLLAPAGDRRALADVKAQLGVMLLNLAQVTESVRELQAARTLFEELDDVAGQGRTLEILGMNRWLAGDIRGAITALEPAITMLRAVGDRRTEIAAFVSLGAARTLGEGMDAGRPPMATALEGALALGARSDEALVRGTTAHLALAFGLWGEAYSEATAALAIARDLQHREWTSYALSSLGRAHALSGDAAQARALHGEQLEIARQLGASIWIAEALGRLGQALFKSGDLAGARPLLEEAVAVAGECAEKAVYPLLTLAEIALREGRPDAALVMIERFHAVGSEYRPLRIEAALIAATARAAGGNPTAAAEAIQSLGDVIRDAEALGMPVVRWRATLERVRLLHQHGRAEAAGREAREARALLERFASALPEPLAQTFRDSEAMGCASSLLASVATAE